MTTIKLEFGNKESIEQLRREEKILKMEELLMEAYALAVDIQPRRSGGKRGNLDPRLIEILEVIANLTDDFEIIDTTRYTITEKEEAQEAA